MDGVGTDAFPVHNSPQCGLYQGVAQALRLAPVWRKLRAAGIRNPANADDSRDSGVPRRRLEDYEQEENRLNFRMSPETAEKLEHWYRQDGCRSKNEFLERAVNYYADHLAAGTSTMLPRAVQSAIDGRLQLLEQRLSSLLFKQAVELDMGLSLLAECVNLDESVLRKQRAKSVNDVKRTNGQLRLEQKVRVQEPFDEWPD